MGAELPHATLREPGIPRVWRMRLRPEVSILPPLQSAPSPSDRRCNRPSGRPVLRHHDEQEGLTCVWVGACREDSCDRGIV